MKKVLVANRGEIAVRIIRACRELNIETVAVYSDVDADSLHVKIADEAYCIGPALSKESYLNMSNIISVATSTNCDGIHPGYGFLAENADFAELCEACNIKFIGPSYQTIQKMGIKDVAKGLMKEAHVPCVPGSDGIIDTVDEAIQVANDIGYPIIIKAAHGGGGKGIRKAYDEEELIQGFNMTQKEAESAFGNKSVYLEKCIENFRHIEFQIFADEYGHVIHLGERDCTIQRRMQKLIEEAPSRVLTERMRQDMGEASVRAAKACDYKGAGTIEFIYDLDANEYYFMEMNTRIQVEHPVTEMVTGIDLVAWQLKIASGEHLTIHQEEVNLNGHAFEFRINAENPFKNFMPTAGRIKDYILPGGFGVRIDSACFNGYAIPPYYDSMVAKLIIHADNRQEAINRSKRALEEFNIGGISSTIPFHLAMLNNEDFNNNNYNTNYLSKHDIMGSIDE
ncbi:acetyl-CoA carboxylase biotin carboxylase subunit [Abyssicoccus albus]|uniref:acetyl-CoA carboxylase biotin carboxylase subunit n=1 Tax=Abyssicoccus albus TaxID=1817405 RepID=UPI00097E19D5|nr:acetyl-CoA carboxylase biotin carboxylase subunit [Abyssicoccus albus]AQL56106.1 acetyl-CoA carboxylase biotin carboxylase subunit [Abyssicoccus albus]